ncbi:hypothetical protein MBLNU230_g4916t1 [Neophaeotheca triangularis]
MPHSDDYDMEGDDTEMIAVATQAETSQDGPDMDESPRPAKRRRVGRAQLDGASSDEIEWSGSDVEKPTKPITRKPDFLREDEDTWNIPGELGPGESAAKTSKHKIHVPKDAEALQDRYFTQTQAGLDSSPTTFRGAIWKKPSKAPPPPLFEKSTNVPAPVSGNASRPPSKPPAFKPPRAAQGLSAANDAGRRMLARPANPVIENDAAMAARLQAEEDSLGRGPSQTTTMPVNPAKPSASFDYSEELADLPSDAFSSSAGSPEKEVITVSSGQPRASQLQPGGLRAPQGGLKQMTIFGQPATQNMTASQAATKKHAWPMKAREEPPTHHELDDKAMETWVYPTNLGTVRDYQYNIVSRSLFSNTLVALPTGLGKTFIAAALMLNYYRWTKNAQIVFMAPTKPLIAQQMEACYHLVGIPRQDTVLMTGETSPAVRAEEWIERRVFFMTPQTVINDLKHGTCDPKRIVLLVVDEAHKATGSYAYTEVVSFLRRFNSSFRVQALTATPGSKVAQVQDVINNLGIARIEVRTEQSLDIRQFTHEKHTEIEMFDYSDEQALIMELCSKALRPTLEKLNTQNAYWSKDPMNLTAYGITQAQRQWNASDAGKKAPMGLKGMVNGIFAVLASIAHNIGLLKNHGIGPFYSGMLTFRRDIESGAKKGKYATQIAQSEDFTKMMDRIRGWTNNPDFMGHPKLSYLREVVLNHFLDAGDGNHGADRPPSSTRIMIFTSFRDSAEEVCRVMKRNEPMIRPHVFVGQAASKGSEGMNQKKQNEVIKDFKAGKYNTLVATSIGEEGLDIGDVDLIICYDSSASPIRMLQRIGRTGRKRVGRVQLLLMNGKESNDWEKAKDNYQSIQKSIADPLNYEYRVDQSPRILPKDVSPAVDKRVVDIPVENTQPIDLAEKSRKARAKGKKRPPKKFNMPDNVRTGFTKASRIDGSEDDSEVEAAPRPRAKNAIKRTASKKQAESPEPEAVQLPFLEDVLLDNFNQKELERRYAQVAESDGNLVIRAPDVSRFPSALRTLGLTTYVRHGRGATATSKAMQALHDIDEGKLKAMQEALHLSDLNDVGDARHRLVSPEAEAEPEEAGLPTRPPPKAARSKTKKAAPRKKQPLARAVSYGSAAGEGAESSPEPTPANMRIGTQGIDLGSDDTDGEDAAEEQQYDSELDDFVVRSDQTIEVVSSSLPGSQEAVAQRPKGKKAAGRLKRKAGSERLTTVLELEDEEAGEVMELEDSDGEENEGVGVADGEVEKGPPVKPTHVRKRRVVEESEEDD